MPGLLGAVETSQCWGVPGPKLAPFEPKSSLEPTFLFCLVRIPHGSWAGAPTRKNPSLALPAPLLPCCWDDQPSVEMSRHPGGLQLGTLLVPAEEGPLSGATTGTGQSWTSMLPLIIFGCFFCWSFLWGWVCPTHRYPQPAWLGEQAAPHSLS